MAELRCRRGETVGLRMENQGLKNENTLLKTWLDREIVRGDKLEQIDKNSQRMDSNSLTIQAALEARIIEKNEKIAELTDDLRSCQSNQKWIFGAGAVAGGVAGYLIKGQTDRFLGERPFNRAMAMPMKPDKSFFK